MVTHELFPAGSTGTGRKSIANAQVVGKAYVSFTVSAVGGTPAISWTIQGSHDGTNWFDLEYVTDDTATARAKAAQTSVALATTNLFIDGLDTRFWEFLAVNVASNTNVTFKASLVVAPKP